MSLLPLEFFIGCCIGSQGKYLVNDICKLCSFYELVHIFCVSLVGFIKSTIAISVANLGFPLHSPLFLCSFFCIDLVSDSIFCSCQIFSNIFIESNFCLFDLAISNIFFLIAVGLLMIVVPPPLNHQHFDRVAQNNAFY